ncbi:uncharacterized protein LOC135164771 [Diachasmimorpha longicaudata]|uniref:uncharacterized protein LOC135164770 n=1 Tax=Diachasmimorpha longicaudata TaxID=58733 RepID=UPI0030B8DEBE
MASFEVTLGLNTSRGAFIERVHNELLDNEVDQLTITSLHAKLDILETYWEKFEATHEKLVGGSAKVDNVLELSYFKDSLFDRTIVHYHEAKGILVQLIDRKGVSTGSRRSAAGGTAQPSTAKRCLPEIALPKYSGVFSEWRSFRDLFSSLVGSNPDIPNVEKMHYLRTSLKDEPARIISNIAISDDSFASAWELLLTRYENKRLLVSAQLERLLNPPGMTAHSARELNTLLTTVAEALNALEALGSPTAHWDQVLVYVVSKRLSSKLREAWEVKVGSSTDFPSFSAFKDFLTGRARAMESMEINTPARSTDQATRPTTVSSRRPPLSVKVHHAAAPQPQQTRPTPRNTSSGKVTYPCSMCQADHYLSTCTSFRQLNGPARREIVERYYLCYNCLGRHSVKDCRSQTRCQLCGGLHHTMLHSTSTTAPPKPSQRPSSRTAQGTAQNQAASSSARPSGVPMVTYTYGDGVTTIAVSCSARQLDSGITDCRPGVLLATSLAYLVCPDGAAHRIRLLIDPGSEISLIGDQIVRRLGLTRSKTSLLISGIGNSASGPALGKVPLTIQSTHSSFQLRVTAYALSQLTTSLPTFTPGQLKWDHLEGLQLADPSFQAPAPIDVLLGADVYGQLILPEVITHDPGSPSAQLTRLGWVIFGPTESVALAHTATAHLAVSNEDLDGLLTRFWVQEEVPETSEIQLTDEEAQCEEHFRRTHTRDCSGRYIVRLPLKAPPSVLGDSRTSALACLHRLLRKFSRDEEYHQLYTDFLKEYEALGHMRRVSGQLTQTAHRQRMGEYTALGTTLAHEAPASGGLRVPNSSYSAQAVTSPEYFFPHHGVVRTSSETTKMRVVFNGSHKTSSGQTLNEIMHTGAKLQRDIADVLLFTRRHKLIFMTDITKMFRQIGVHQDDWPLQQILWADANGNVTTYQLTTVTYGTRSAPFLSIRVLNQLVEDEGSNYPLAVEPLTKGRYVDDICGGADSEEELLKTAHHVTQLCQSGGFPLAKWHSNSAGLLSTLRLDSTSHDQKVIEDSITKILGVSWHPGTDSFTFSIARPETNSISKRIILSETAQLFDPLGFLAPVVVRAKILLQALWIEKLGWDDPVSPTTAHRWRQFRDELNQLSEVTVPRWLGLLKGFDVEVHGFSDASQVAMAAVIYLKVPHLPGNGITLVCSKTKVAPLKRLTIPRLELTAALLLAKLIRYVQDQLNLSAAPTYLWTDSSVTLTWISSHPSRWKEFVRNRVALIQELTQPSHWRLVPGKENPADCASRGLTAQQLAAHKLWWTGPPWLQQDSSSWPTHVLERDLNVDLEEKPGQIYYGAAQQIAIWDLIDKFSSFNRLLRITAICSRFIARLRRVPNTSLHYPLTLSELEDARLLWIKLTQTAHFREELRIISRGEKFTRSHPLTKLTPFIDRQGILRVGGRLRFAQLDPESKNQAIIPKESQLARLLISQAHLRTLHGGTQLTLRQLRTAYWILGGRAPVRSFILKCVKCARQRGIRAQQLMGQLPPARLTPARAFLNTGVDYAGPISLRSWKGRGHKSYKGWLAIFVCMTTSAVHLEVVSDYSADTFLAAYRRFSSRRGIAHTLFSDCGTTFLGADRELRRLFIAGSSKSRQLAQLLIQDGTQWSFNPPSAPHFGGKWEAAVKSVKYHLTRTIGEDLLTFEELTTLLTQVEAVLNSRPLEPLTDDPDDCSALTPGHFLIGQAPTTLPEPSLENLNISRLSRWQLIQQKLQGFWKRWSTGYLQRLQAISKWYHPTHDINVGSLVLLTDERFPPSKWPLARVTALHPGKDGLTRVVTLRTAQATLTRPIVKLVLLPVPTSRT